MHAAVALHLLKNKSVTPRATCSPVGRLAEKSGREEKEKGRKWKQLSVLRGPQVNPGKKKKNVGPRVFY